MKYTRELLEPLVRESTSYRQVIEKLGVKQGGGTQANLVNRIKVHGLSTKHFLGKAACRGLVSNKRLHFSEVLVEVRTSRREHADVLRRAMLEAGIPHECAVCKQGPFWESKILVLQIDHEDGHWWNNKIGNVRFLCPNCHSQTRTFGTRNRTDLKIPTQVKHMLEAADLFGVGKYLSCEKVDGCLGKVGDYEALPRNEESVQH